MGVGKTIEALGIAYIYKDDWPLLIICPASLVKLFFFIQMHIARNSTEGMKFMNESLKYPNWRYK